MEDDRPPKQSKSGKILYELEYNVLRVWEVPSMAHDAAASAQTRTILRWSENNNMAAAPTLEVLGGGRNQSV